MKNILIGILILFLIINSVNCFNMTILNLKEGSNCTYEDKPGKCVNFFKCERLVLDMPEKKYPPICSFDGKVPIVCCTSCRLVDNIDDAIKVSSGFIYWKNGNKSHDRCSMIRKSGFDDGRPEKSIGTYKNECLEYARYANGKCRVSGGEFLYWNKTEQCDEMRGWAFAASGGRNAKRGEMPHMALLGYGSELESVEWICGGSLISEKFILTAAHCTESDLLGPVTFVALGILSRTDPPETWQRYKVKTIIPHPEYKPPAKYHDIALLETEQRIKLSTLVIPACLPERKQYENDKESLRLSAAGWGATRFRSKLADTLQVIRVEGFSEKECQEHYPPHKTIPHGYDNTTQLCFGDRKKAVDTCEGDSGGPLQDFNHFCMFTILGVTSFGRACGFVGNAGIYTRVSHYIPWIEKIVWK